MRKPGPTKTTSGSFLANLPTWLHVSDVQGLAQLATQGVLGVAGLAETVQGNVYKTVAAPFGPLGARFVDHTPGASGVKARGITGLVYGSVKGVTRLAGGAVNTVLSGAAPLVGEQASSPPREAMLSAINGVLGDQLLETANPLAITMSLRHDGEILPLEKAALAQRLPHATGKLLVLVHGLCMNDLQWGSGHDSHADALAHALGYMPVYLHYNTGLHTSVNGQQFAALLEQLVAGLAAAGAGDGSAGAQHGRPGLAQRLPSRRCGRPSLAQRLEAIGVSRHTTSRRAAGDAGQLGRHAAGRQCGDPTFRKNRPDQKQRHHRPALRLCTGLKLAGCGPV